jgi:hypothetical protein
VLPLREDFFPLGVFAPLEGPPSPPLDPGLPDSKQHDSLTLQEEFTLPENDAKRSWWVYDFILDGRCKNATRASPRSQQLGRR